MTLQNGQSSQNNTENQSGANNTETVNTSNLVQGSVSASALAESKATTTQAQNVDTDLTQGGTTLPSENNWSSDTYKGFGYKGSFDVPLKDLVAGNTIVIGNFNASSSNGKYMKIVPDGGTHYIQYTDPITHETTAGVGTIAFNKTSDNSGQILFNIVKTVYTDSEADKADELVHFTFDIQNLVTLNYLTDKHVFQGTTAENPYSETLNMAGKSYSFKVAINMPAVAEHLPSSNVNRYVETQHGMLQDSNYSYCIKNDQTFQDLQNSQGQTGDVYIPDTYKFYYKITVKDPNDFANYGFHNPQVSFFGMAMPANSDGKLTYDYDKLNAGNVALTQAADNLTYDQLDASVGTDGAAYSKQSDGSYIFVVHISPDTIRNVVKDVPSSLTDTATEVFDQDPDKANQATQHYYNDGALKGLPIGLVPSIQLDYNNPISADQVYTLHVMNKNGDTYDEAYEGSMSPLVDTSNNENQGGVTIHYLDGDTGEEMPGYETATTTFGDPGASTTVDIPSFAGYHLDNNVTVTDGNIVFGNGAKQVVKSGDVVLNGSTNTVTRPAAGQVINVYVVYNGDSVTDTINYVDEDDNNKLLHTDTASGKVGELQNYSTSDVISQFPNYYLDKDELAEDDQANGITGIKFGTTGKTYTVYLKHRTQDKTTTKTITETINYKYTDGRQAATPVTKSVTFTDHYTVDLVTGKHTADNWDVASQQFPEVDSPTIEGYTPNLATVDAQTVTPDSNDIVVNVVYASNNPGGDKPGEPGDNPKPENPGKTPEPGKPGDNPRPENPDKGSQPEDNLKHENSGQSSQSGEPSQALKTDTVKVINNPVQVQTETTQTSNRLPQTGNDGRSAIVLGTVSLLGMLGLATLDKKHN